MSLKKEVALGGPSNKMLGVTSCRKIQDKMSIDEDSSLGRPLPWARD